MAIQVAENSLKAFAALADGRYADAESAWRHVPDIAGLPIAFAAVALNNAAIGRLTLGDRAQSKALLQRAAGVSELLRAHAMAASSEPRGTSSSFHFRLAAKHTMQFSSAANARRVHIASAIAAIIGRHLDLAGSRHEERTSENDQPLRTAFGCPSAEVALLHACRKSQITAGYAARLFRLRQSLAASATNERQGLEIALAAMGILPPALVGAASVSSIEADAPQVLQ